MTKEQVLQELQEISVELGIELKNEKVLLELSKRKRPFGGIPSNIFDEILPMYYKSEDFVYAIKLNEKDEVIAIKKTKDSQWEFPPNNSSNFLCNS